MEASKADSPNDLPPPVELEHPKQESGWEIPPELGVKALAFMNMTWNVLSQVGTFIWSVGKGIWRSIQPENYVFFTGSSYPYNMNDLNLNSPGVAPIAWYYNASRRIFVAGHLHNTSENFRTHHLPFLSAEIKYNDLALYDITEFMEKVRWAGDSEKEPPSANILLAVWTLHTGIVLYSSDSLKLVVIDDEGNEKTFMLKP